MTKITKRGNSKGVNIHPLWLEKLGWEEGTQVVMEVVKGKLVIKKA